MNTKNGIITGAIALVSFLTILVFSFSNATDSYARAGGGEDFGGGGFDSFDSGSSFDSDWGSSSPSTTGTGSGGSLPTGWPICCGVLVVGLIIFVILKKKGIIKPGTPGAPLPTSIPKQPLSPDEVQSDISERKQKLAESDQNWNEQRFLDMTETIFHTVQEAWTKNELNIARPYLTESIYTRYRKQLSDLSARGLRNVLQNIVVGSTEIVKIEQDKSFDTVSIKIRASMIDYKEEKETGKFVSGYKSQSPPFTEYWTFIRKNGAKTPEVPTIQEKKCPNCGAPLEINESGKCKYCKANVVSGDFDWVLSKITQRDEWKP